MTQAYYVAIIPYVILIALTVLLLLRQSKNAEAKGVGVRRIQFLAVVCIVPGLIVLRLHEKVSYDAVMTLIGAVVGYVLSNIKNFKPSAGRTP